MADTETEIEADTAPTVTWMSDVQRALVLMMVGTFCLIVIMASGRLIWSAETDTIEDLTKTLNAALVNMVLIGLGFFFGNTISKLAGDRSQQKIVDKLTSATPGTLPPTPTPPPPPPPPAPLAPWWGKLTDAEKTAITDAGANDERVKAFITASMIGAATADDLAYIVTKGLVPQTRADEISKSN